MTQPTAHSARTTVYRLSAGVANVYLLRGVRDVLVDAATPGSEVRIARWLRRLKVTPESLSLIVLTHVHRDHVGAAAALRAAFDAPIAIPRAGLAAARGGRDRYGRPTGPFGHFISAAFPRSFAPLEPDVLLDDGRTLDEFGVAATVIHTHGHTDHCMSVITDAGDAVVGDLLTGHHVVENRPGLPYLLECGTAWRQSVERLGDRSLARMHPGHGRSFAPPSGALPRNWSRAAGEV